MLLVWTDNTVHTSKGADMLIEDHILVAPSSEETGSNHKPQGWVDTLLVASDLANIPVAEAGGDKAARNLMQEKEAGGKAPLGNNHTDTLQLENLERRIFPPEQVVDRVVERGLLLHPDLAMHWMVQRVGDTSG